MAEAPLTQTQTQTQTPQPLTLVHTSSRRVTAAIGFHSFAKQPPPAGHESSLSSSSSPPERWLRPTQNVTLQFPADLDPTAGTHGLSGADRRCTLTPCAATRDDVSILTRNGRITGLLGLPRPYQTLTADVVGVGGGFAVAVLADATRCLCVAGGTGVAPFLTMPHTGTKSLCWSLRSDDFGAVAFVLREALLRPDEWSSVSVFVTSGEDAGGLVAEKPAAWWAATFATLRETYPGNLHFAKRRMASEDVASEETTGNRTVLFCGSKSLEWQIRMWTMGQATVYVTEV
ncbi:uncharacterized protein SPSK_10649 [Sporothrix schenckii 1099-18]|uniref:FAD-binding FR-type domain-containing protein n=2 Tax=Sporothrix schenckii TaxID=29908 RepID=U7Q3M7_SPOS1|nr:uncharacterized protein SPSK_10649 [Sporothrix schenckii 1099-18]ERT02423.1 hypothetical protein HMPREF1624_00721 [Sporothrix schenckii ATCC 58251]KJR80307.1 hypothetical protein SPSK_10649 [Sporothrix schenckii 1099-18]